VFISIFEADDECQRTVGPERRTAEQSCNRDQNTKAHIGAVYSPSTSEEMKNAKARSNRPPPNSNTRQKAAWVMEMRLAGIAAAEKKRADAMV